MHWNFVADDHRGAIEKFRELNFEWLIFEISRGIFDKVWRVFFFCPRDKKAFANSAGETFCIDIFEKWKNLINERINFSNIKNSTLSKCRVVKLKFRIENVIWDFKRVSIYMYINYVFIALFFIDGFIKIWITKYVYWNFLKIAPRDAVFYLKNKIAINFKWE